MTPEEKLEKLKNLMTINDDDSGTLIFKNGQLTFANNEYISMYVSQEIICDYAITVYREYLKNIENSIAKTTCEKIQRMFEKELDKPYMPGARVGPFSFNSGRINPQSLSDYNRQILPRIFYNVAASTFNDKIQSIIEEEKLKLLS